MKKIILIITILLIITKWCQSQTVDTTVWEFQTSGTSELFTKMTNKISYYGKSAYTIIMPIYIYGSSLDTSIWELQSNQIDYKYNYVLNKVEWYGKNPYTVKAILIYAVNSSSFDADSLFSYLDTTRIAFYDKDGTFRGVITFDGNVIMSKAYIDTLISHYIDSLQSTTWYNALGEKVAEINVANDTVAIFKTLKFGAGYGGTLINSDSVSAPKFVTDSIGSNSPLHILSDSVIVNNLYADTLKTAVLIMNGTEFVIGTFVGGVMYDRWIVENAGHLIPATTSTYDIGNDDYKVKKIYADTVKGTDIEATTITATNLKTANVIGTTAWRDTNSFDNQAESDTVTVSGASASDLYWVQTMGQTVNTADYCVVEPTATGFIVRRSASGTANLRYSWMRIK